MFHITKEAQERMAKIHQIWAAKQVRRLDDRVKSQGAACLEGASPTFYWTDARGRIVSNPKFL